MVDNRIVIEGSNEVPLLQKLYRSGVTSPTLVLIHAPWCPWCMRLRPEWDALCETVENDIPNMQILEIDRQAVSAALRQHDPILEAIDSKSTIGTVPQICLVLDKRQGSSRSSQSDPGSRKDALLPPSKKGFDVHDYDEYIGGPDSKGEHRSQENILYFVRDCLR